MIEFKSGDRVLMEGTPDVDLVTRILST